MKIKHSQIHRPKASDNFAATHRCWIEINWNWMNIEHFTATISPFWRFLFSQRVGCFRCRPFATTTNFHRLSCVQAEGQVVDRIAEHIAWKTSEIVMQEAFTLLIMLLCAAILTTYTVWKCFVGADLLVFGMVWYGLINCLDFCCLAESANCIWRCKGEWQRWTQIDHDRQHLFRATTRNIASEKKRCGSVSEVVWMFWYLLYLDAKLHWQNMDLDP